MPTTIYDYKLMLMQANASVMLPAVMFEIFKSELMLYLQLLSFTIKITNFMKTLKETFQKIE